MDDIRKAAEALIEACESGKFYGEGLSSIQQYKDLKAALRPSKEEVVNYLAGYLQEAVDMADYKMKIMMFNQAMQYLEEES